MQIEALETVFAQLLGANPIVGNLLLLRNVLIRNLRIRFGLSVVASVGIVVVGETQHSIRSGFHLAVSERGMALRICMYIYAVFNNNDLLSLPCIN